MSERTRLQDGETISENEEGHLHRLEGDDMEEDGSSLDRGISITRDLRVGIQAGERRRRRSLKIEVDIVGDTKADREESIEAGNEIWAGNVISGHRMIGIMRLGDSTADDQCLRVGGTTRMPPDLMRGIPLGKVVGLWKEDLVRRGWARGMRRVVCRRRMSSRRVFLCGNLQSGIEPHMRTRWVDMFSPANAELTPFRQLKAKDETTGEQINPETIIEQKYEEYRKDFLVRQVRSRMLTYHQDY
jgi:hypothetical protein